MRFVCKLISFMLLLLISEVALAQGTSPVTTATDSGLDLPISPPRLGGGSDRTPPETPDDDGDDPSDTPPPTIYGEELESENDTIFYVLDISCSMGWGDAPFVGVDGQTRSGPRIDRAKSELARSIMGLSNNFHFNIIAYDCGIRQWEQDMRPATDVYKASAISWVMQLRPVGATGTGPATAQALGDKDNMMVVLLTDGIPNCGADGLDGHRRMISNANTQGAAINVFGIAASGSYRAFCQSVASDSGGSYFDIP